MDFRYLKLAVTFLLVESIWSLPVACPYNGTAFGEGETVRMEEPCLLCVCQGGALECSLRVCADQPTVLPPGCFFLHKPNECCPQLFCEEGSFNPAGIELRTDLKLENKLNGNDCTINGSRYAEGSAVASTQVCEYCYCVEGETKCIKPRCLQSFEGCKAIYEKSSCCPTQYDCRDADIDLLRTQIKSFVLADVDSNNFNHSLTTVSNLDLDNKNTFNESESGENLSEEEGGGGEPREEVEETTTTTEDITTEETTPEPERETTTTTTTPTEDDLTSTGFQTMKTEYSNKESTVAGTTTEGTTLEPETTTDAFSSVKEETEETSNTQNGVDFPESTENPAVNGSRRDSAQEADDYEAYDYGEPQLPPSLPNLVIFPFVAADAVVKDDTGVLDTHDRLEIKRIDAHPVFYKDYFSPPVKTEGGFVPKESFFEEVYFREDQVESPGADSKAASGCQEVTCPLPLLDKQWTTLTSTVSSDLENVKPPYGEETRPAPDTPTDFIFKDETPTLLKIQQTKKPVTVTYKNVVVDFYPNYLITTTRARPKIQPGGNPATEIQLPVDATPKIPNGVADAATDIETQFVDRGVPPSTSPKAEETLTVAASTGGTTAASSFFDEFFKTFFSDEIITTTTTTTTASVKHKYSAKIKGHANAVRDESGEKVKQEEPKTDSLLNVIRTEDSAAAESSPVTEKERKGVKKDGIKSITEASLTKWSATGDAPPKINRETVEFFQALGKDKGKQEGGNLGQMDGSNSAKPDSAGALLKLAGCNIYGMMYRVGKVITELSGPCLECLCTDLGVQCSPLGC